MYLTVDGLAENGDETYFQCLIFVLRKDTCEDAGKIDSMSKKIKGFVLLPSFVSENDTEITQLFSRNSFEILDHQSYSFLQKDVPCKAVDILELVIKRGTGKERFPSKTTPFFPISVEGGHHEQVRQLFGVDAVVYSNESYTLLTLCRAINEKNAAILELVLKGFTDLCYKNLCDETLLHFAARRGDEIFSKLLIKHGFNLNARSKDCSTPLHVAVETDNSEITKLLLQSGASINARRNDGATSLFLAIDVANLTIAELLLTSGADVNIGKHNGLMPLHVAACGKNRSTLIQEILQRNAFVNSSAAYCHAQGITPLCLAVESEDLESVKCLLKYGADVNIPCYDNQTILKLAVDLDYPNIVEEILKYHPDLNHKINNQAIYSSMNRKKRNSNAICSMLSEYGFGVDLAFDNSSEFLHSAICEGSAIVVERLIKSGISVNRVYHYENDDNDNDSGSICTTNLLLTAIKHNKNDIVKLLIDLGADVSVDFELHSGDTNVIQCASESNNWKAVKILLTNNIAVTYIAIVGNGWEYFVPNLILLTNNKDIIEKIIFECSKVHGTNSLVDTFQHAAQDGRLQVLIELLNFGFYIDSRNVAGNTALHRLAYGENGSKVIKFLIKNNADIEARCFTGQTPLIAAANAGNSEVVFELLKYGAKIDPVDNYGRSSLCYVVAGGHHKLFEALLAYFFADRDFISRMNIHQVLTFSYSSLENVGDDADEWLIEQKTDFEKCMEVLKIHLIKAKVAFSNDGNVVYTVQEDFKTLAPEKFVSSSFELHSFWDYHEVLCHEHGIERLKTDVIGDSDVTFYDILTKNEQQVTHYARNDSMRKIFDSMLSESCCSYYYSSVLFYQIQKGTFRRSLLDQSAKLCHLLVSELNVLPADLKEKVLNYLSNCDLEVLIHACSCISHSKTSCGK